MMRPFPPELRLAAACATWPPSDRRTEAIRAAVARPLDWPRFLRVAKRHEVVALVHDGLAQVRPHVPSDIAREIGAQAATLVRQNLAMARESLRIQRLLDDANLPVLFVKGSALAVLAFGKLGLRSSQDIDLLVAYEMLPAVTALILSAGYSRFDPPADISDAQLNLLMPLRKDLGFVNQAQRNKDRTALAPVSEPARDHRRYDHDGVAGRTCGRGCRTAHVGRRRSFCLSLHARRTPLVESA